MSMERRGVLLMGAGLAGEVVGVGDIMRRVHKREDLGPKSTEANADTAISGLGFLLVLGCSLIEPSSKEIQVFPESKDKD